MRKKSRQSKLFGGRQLEGEDFDSPPERPYYAQHAPIKGPAVEGGFQMKATEPLGLYEDGKHTGTVESIEHRKVVLKKDGSKANYIRIAVTPDDAPFHIMLDAPEKLSSATKLGRFYEGAMGKKLVVGQDYDLDDLKGKRISFSTVGIENKDGRKFARLVEGSISPLK
jgi:hypothetical protein